MYSAPKRIEYLDSIRGLAALFVLLSHTFGAFDWPAACIRVLHWPFIYILSDGRAAVAMFFVLSGYVLSKPYVAPVKNAPPRRIFLPTFYLRRFTRIWLPWFFFFLASIFAKSLLFYLPSTQPPISAWLGNFWHVPLTVGDFLRQCAFLLHDPHRQLLVQDWSLGVELKGSALIPLFIFLSPRKRMGWLVLVTALLLALVGTGHYYVSFIIGVLTARYGVFWVEQLSRLGLPLKLAFLIFGLTLYQVSNWLIQCYGGTPAVDKYGWLVTAIGCGLILLFAFGSSRIQRLLNHKAAVFLGRVSYSVYLLQFIIILCLLPQLVKLCNHWGITNTTSLFFLTTLVSVLATVGCSALTWKYVEIPAINLGHWLTRKIQPWFHR